MFSRLIAGLSADSNITKRNFSTALLFLSSENPDILNLKLWKKATKEKLNLDDVEYSDGKRIYKNVCYGKVLSLSLQAQIFADSLDWKSWQTSCLDILQKEPSTKALVLELFHRNSEKLESFTLTEETNPVDVAHALRTKDKAFIKKVFGSKTVDLNQENQKALVLVLLDKCYSDTYQIQNHPFIQALALQKNAANLIKDLAATAKTKSRKKACLELFVEKVKIDGSFELLDSALLGLIRALLHSPMKSWTIDYFFVEFRKFFSTLGSEQQISALEKFLEFEPSFDQNTRSRNVINLVAALNVDAAKTYALNIVNLYNNSETSRLSEALPDSTHDRKKWCISMIENLVTHNKSMSKESTEQVMKFLFETAFISEPQKFSQQAIYTILSNTKSLDFDIFSLLKEYKKKIPKEFPKEIIKLSSDFKIKSMQNLMKTMIIKLFECCVNEAEEKKNESDLSIQLSKRRGDISESEELKAVILDLVAIEKDIVDKKQVDDEGNHWSEVLVEILISLMTKESKTLRKAVVDSFRFIVSDLSIKSIEILADTISGQNNDGFGLSVNEEVETDSEDDSEDDEEASEEEEEAGEEDEDSSEEEENQEIDASFHKSLSAIVNAEGNESEEAGSEMDEQMMELDEKLSKVFRERKRHLGKRQKQELEAQAMNFRLRNLDFIEVLACSRTAGMGLNYATGISKN